MASAAENKKNQKSGKAMNNEDEINVSISLFAMFDMREEKNIYQEQGKEMYTKYDQQHAHQLLKPGAAFPFAKALMMVNSYLKFLHPESQELFKILLMVPSELHPGTRLKRSIEFFEFPREAVVIREFGSTAKLIDELKSSGSKLYLSENTKPDGAEYGIPAATVSVSDVRMDLNNFQLRVAFDGDGIIFSDEAEKITQKKGLEAFFQHEETNRDKPLPKGPLSGFLEVLMKLQAKFRAEKMIKNCPIRTYLVTSRGLMKSGARVMNSLEHWGMEIDEAHFLSGGHKAPVLQAIKPQIFFDDQMRHVLAAREAGIVGAHVPYGVANE
ncbi:cytosolic 5'-nucleotidase 1A-like [Trichomycterus rosablanca]|uniref:cytosolic 5'-nucleotidase 1A-like n=1 Tax=Trichomycterus rosablanca TaxID=2290929 RepID=UPI002F3526DD